MSRIRVAQVIPDLGIGGAERMVASLAAHLDRSKVHVTVITMFAPEENHLQRALCKAGIETVHLGKRLGFDPRMFHRIRAALARAAPDVVHTHRYVLAYALPALLTLRVRAVHTMHTLASQEVGSLGRVAYSAAFRSKVSAIAIGDVVAKSVERVFGVRPRALIRHGIAVERFSNPQRGRAAWREDVGIASNDTLIACTARLAPPKNLGALLRAFALLQSKVPGVALAIAGDGGERAKLEELSRALGVAQKVRFLGSREDVPEMLNASDIFALSSAWEGTPLSVMEAMAAGLPVVSFAVGGVPELVTDSTGRLVPVGDEAGLARELVHLAEDAQLRRDLSSNARAHANAHFCVDRMAREHEDLYAALCGA